MTETGKLPDGVDVDETEALDPVIEPWTDPGVYADDELPDDLPTGDPDHPLEPGADEGV